MQSPKRGCKTSSHATLPNIQCPKNDHDKTYKYYNYVTFSHGNKTIIDEDNLYILQHVCAFVVAMKRVLLQFEHISIMNISCIYEYIFIYCTQLNSIQFIKVAQFVT